MASTVLSIPNNGRLPIWTGPTQSGMPGTMLNLSNRTVQLHVSTSDTLNDQTFNIRDQTLQQLSTYLFEYPTRHFGIFCDELEPAGFILPQINDNANIRLQRHPAPLPINHLRLSEPETIGRDLYHGCPDLFNQLGPDLQASEILFSHHKQRHTDVLIIKITIIEASPSYTNDFLSGFRTFEFNTPMMFRNHFKLNERNHIFRKRMTTFVKVFTIANAPVGSTLRTKLSEIDFFKFELQFNDELVAKLPNKLNNLFNDNVLARTAICVLNQIFQLGLIYDQGVRASAAESQQIFDYMLEDDDPSVQILKDHLSLDLIYELSVLCSTKIIKTRNTVQYVIKFQISC